MRGLGCVADKQKSRSTITYKVGKNPFIASSAGEVPIKIKLPNRYLSDEHQAVELHHIFLIILHVMFPGRLQFELQDGTNVIPSIAE